MINTVQIKQQQLEKGFFTIGSGPEVIFVMGSCRIVNFITYLSEWSLANGNRFTIHSLDPFNFYWNDKDERVDHIQAIEKCETEAKILDMLKSVDIFLHEHYSNFGMFNCKKQESKTIYKFGLEPKIDICIPSWNDNFVLASDLVSFDLDLRKKSIQDYNVLGKLSEQTKEEIFKKSQYGIERFYYVCRSSDVPEMADYFSKNITRKRLFWTFNHTTKWFTLALFNFINDKFLHLDLSKGFNPDHEDIFANNYTKLTELDVEMYGYDWGEEIIPLKEKLF